MALEFSESQRGHMVLVYKDFEYIKLKEDKNSDVITWRCRQYHTRTNHCKAFIKTNKNDVIVEPTSHTHDSCPQKAKANIAVSQMKTGIKCVGATSKNVIGSVLINVSNDVLQHIPKQSSLSRTLMRHREESHIPIPTITIFDIPEKYIHLVLYGSGKNDPHRIIAIGNIDLLLELNKGEIYGDGTFDKAPSLFYQLYTWHAKVGNSYPPCIYFLLQKKNIQTYTNMCQILKQLLPNLTPQKVLVDFEKVCISAVHSNFPNAEVKGCYFHLCQSLIRKICSVGLKSDFESDIELKLKLKSLTALAFVPINDVRQMFDNLAATFPDDERYNEVLTYFFSTYIEGAIGREPLFPIKLWNHYDAAIESSPKTTNCCEGFHNGLNALFHCSHPSIWSLFDGLEKDISFHRLTLAKAQMGQPEKKGNMLS